MILFRKNTRGAASKLMHFFIILCFLVNLILPASGFAQAVNLPQPGTMLHLSPAYMPALLTGIQLYPENPLQFDFIVNSGDDKLQGEALKIEAEKMIRYFLASLTIPQKDLWVNLSPYEKDRIAPDALSKTEIGRDLLAQDYLLKQITASLIYPENDLGKKFWDRIYKKAYEQYGTTDIPVDTFNKVWIMPDKASVYEHGNMVFVTENRLKVMLEKDYLATEKNTVASKPSEGTIAQNIVREIVLPELEKEVNTGKNFAQLRQVYNSLILAVWFKQSLKQSLLGQVYVDQGKVSGIDLASADAKEKIYQQYLEAYQKGAYNFIKVEHDQYTNKNIPRKYFSGGFTTNDLTVGSSTMINRQAVSDDGNTGFKVALVSSALRGVRTGETIIAFEGEIIDAVLAAYPNEKHLSINFTTDDKYTDAEDPSDATSALTWSRATRFAKKVESISFYFDRAKSVRVEPLFPGNYSSWKVVEVKGLEERPEIPSLYKADVVKKINLIPQDERIAAIKEAKYNLFNLSSNKVFVDYLTDSGTGAMSDQQAAAMMLHDESYAGSVSYARMEASIKDVLGFGYVLPTHQGRAAENVINKVLITPERNIVLGNPFFDTTAGHIDANKGKMVELPVPENEDLDSEFPFKGNIDLAKLRTALIENKDKVAYILMTVTDNLSGGQPVSMENLKGARALASEFGVPFFGDIARFAENAYFIKEREAGYQDKSIREIVKEMMSVFDAVQMSAKKDGLTPMGGFIAMRSEDYKKKFEPFVIYHEGFLNYGGISGKDMEIIAQGFQEVVDESYLKDRIAQARYLGTLLHDAGVPVRWPVGGHGVFIDGYKFFNGRIPKDQFPAQALGVALYEEGGIRGVEIGSLLKGRTADGKQILSRHEFLRLAIPRRVYNKEHLKYTADVIINFYNSQRKNDVPGLKVTKGRNDPLMHFTAELAPAIETRASSAVRSWKKVSDVPILDQSVTDTASAEKYVLRNYISELPDAKKVQIIKSEGELTPIEFILGSRRFVVMAPRGSYKALTNYSGKWRLLSYQAKGSSASSSLTNEEFIDQVRKLADKQAGTYGRVKQIDIFKDETLLASFNKVSFDNPELFEKGFLNSHPDQAERIVVSFLPVLIPALTLVRDEKGNWIEKGTPTPAIDKRLLSSLSRMSVQQLPDEQLKGKTVLVLDDLNVPMEGANITDTSRIDAAMETIKYLQSKGAKVVIMSHLGRPKGKVKEEFSLAPIYAYIKETALKGSNVHFDPSFQTMRDAKDFVSSMKEGEILLLQNTRFNAGEEAISNAEDALAKAKKGGNADEIKVAEEALEPARQKHQSLAEAYFDGADVFVNDAFSVSHRGYASVIGAPKSIPRVAGLLVQQETEALKKFLEGVEAVAMGGSKVSDKIKIIRNLLKSQKLKYLLVGGAMRNAFLSAKGIDVKNSFGASEKEVAVAKELIALKDPRIIIPIDVVGTDFSEAAQAKAKEGIPFKPEIFTVKKLESGDEAIPDGWELVDIGPKTVELYRKFILESKMTFMNGAMGIFEIDQFEGGTKGVLQAMADAKEVGGYTGVGGGDTVTAVNKFGIPYERFGHVFLAGGATLEVLEEKVLPGLGNLSYTSSGLMIPKIPSDKNWRDVVSAIREALPGIKILDLEASKENPVVTGLKTKVTRNPYTGVQDVQVLERMQREGVPTENIFMEMGTFEARNGLAFPKKIRFSFVYEGNQGKLTLVRQKEQGVWDIDKAEGIEVSFSSSPLDGVDPETVHGVQALTRIVDDLQKPLIEIDVPAVIPLFDAKDDIADLKKLAAYVESNIITPANNNLPENVKPLDEMKTRVSTDSEGNNSRPFEFVNKRNRMRFDNIEEITHARFYFSENRLLVFARESHGWVYKEADGIDVKTSSAVVEIPFMQGGFNSDTVIDLVNKAIGLPVVERGIKVVLGHAPSVNYFDNDYATLPESSKEFISEIKIAYQNGWNLSLGRLSRGAFWKVNKIVDTSGKPVDFVQDSGRPVVNIPLLKGSLIIDDVIKGLDKAVGQKSIEDETLVSLGFFISNTSLRKYSELPSLSRDMGKEIRLFYSDGSNLVAARDYISDPWQVRSFVDKEGNKIKFKQAASSSALKVGDIITEDGAAALQKLADDRGLNPSIVEIHFSDNEMMTFDVAKEGSLAAVWEEVDGSDDIVSAKVFFAGKGDFIEIESLNMFNSAWEVKDIRRDVANGGVASTYSAHLPLGSVAEILSATLKKDVQWSEQGTRLIPVFKNSEDAQEHLALIYLKKAQGASKRIRVVSALKMHPAVETQVEDEIFVSSIKGALSVAEINTSYASFDAAVDGVKKYICREGLGSWTMVDAFQKENTGIMYLYSNDNRLSRGVILAERQGGTWILSALNTSSVSSSAVTPTGGIDGSTSSPSIPQGERRTGGIDFKEIYEDLKIKTDESGMPLAVEFQDIQNIKIDGLVPVIINITPVSNLPAMLGLGEELENAPKMAKGGELAAIKEE